MALFNSQSAQQQYQQMLQQMNQASQAPWFAGMMGQAGGWNPGAVIGVTTSSRTSDAVIGIDKKLVKKLQAAEPRKALARIPDGVIPITAWRAWAVTGLRLAGLGSSVGWEPKKKQEAQCTGFGPSHLAPKADCSCGFWAFKSLDILLKAAEAYSPKVIGMVSLWGRIIETENGFRAQHAYPKELWLLDSSLEELGRVYDVPIRTA